MMGQRFLICAAVSMTAHVAAAAILFAPDPVHVAGGATPSARLGNSFADVAAGGAVSVPKPERVLPLVAPAAIGASPATSMDATAVAASVTVSVAPSIVATRVTATAPVTVSQATPDTIRPQARSDRREARSSPPAAPAQAGAAQPERRGAADGAVAAEATVAGPETGTHTEAGNAAATHYPGAVMRKINRTRKPRVGLRGTAIVGFEVSGNGGLAGLRVLQSSGAAEIDAAAMDHLRRAAPFPPPPAGAQRRFQVAYDSR